MWQFHLLFSALIFLAGWMLGKMTAQQTSDSNDFHDGTILKVDSDDIGEYKMVFVVNQSLRMGKGKIAAQVAHGCLGCYKLASRVAPDLTSIWSAQGQAKVVCKAPDESVLQSIFDAGRREGLPVYLVHDAGRTQIAAGSQTVLALGPAPVSAFDSLTGHLKLL